MKVFITRALALASLIATVSACTTANEHGENDALDIARAKISLSEAVAAAETHVGGHASRAEFEQAAEGWVFDVEVVKGTAVSDVHVDAGTAAILSVSSDAADDEEDEEDGID